MIELFRECGLKADEIYREQADNAAEFTQIACDLLDFWNLPERVSIDGLWDIAASGGLTGIGDQSKPGLIPLYSGNAVRIVAHLWSDAADRLHQHDWTGAFQVIEGRSFNAVFGFETRGELAEFAFGPIDRRGFDIFERGRVQPVTEGESLIHSVVYANKPGLAISLRVASEGTKGAVEYLRPGLRCPSHRRRDADAAQIDLLSQALQLGEKIYAQRFGLLAARLDDAGLLRLLDAACFDGLPVPDEIAGLAAERLPAGGILLASLDDIERSDKTRELLGEQDDPVVRDFICSLFHSDTRAELAETIRHAGHNDPVVTAGRSLAALLIDIESGPLPPPAVSQALGEIALTGDFRQGIEAMKASSAGDPHLDDHAAFLAQVFEAMEEAPVFRSLFKA
ncbi:hypothetical protein [Hyphobacterium sp.]|uniref:hypothetical protein n=1 Tax=Hyphobacterium sp. TaxID=2004662 RepID=UPI003B51E3F6